MLQLVSPVGWCRSLECLGSCPVVTLCWRQNDHRERRTQDRAKSPQAWDHTHTPRAPWYRSYSTTQKGRRYVNDSSIATGDFLCLCRKLHSKTTILLEVLDMQRLKWPGNPKMLCAICAVLYMAGAAVWMNGGSTIILLLRLELKKGEYGLHVLGMTSRHSCSCCVLHLWHEEEEWTD